MNLKRVSKGVCGRFFKRIIAGFSQGILRKFSKRIHGVISEESMETFPTESS